MSQTERPQDTHEQQAPLLGNRLSIAKLAIALNPDDPPCERSVYNLVDRLNVSYVKVLNVRWYDPDEVRSAILAGEINRQPRRAGRPARRKAA